MDRNPVKSSNVRSVGYDSTDLILEVEFHSGGIYHYLKVPMEIYDGLMNAPSKGKYLDKNVIKRGFAYIQIR